MAGILLAAFVVPALEWVIAGYLMERNEPSPPAVHQGGGVIGNVSGAIDPQSGSP